MSERPAEPAVATFVAPSQSAATEENLPCPLGETLVSVSVKILEISAPVLIRCTVQDTQSGPRRYIIELGQTWIRANSVFSANHYSWIGFVPLSRSVQSELNVEVMNNTGDDKIIRMIANFTEKEVT